MLFIPFSSLVFSVIGLMRSKENPEIIYFELITAPLVLTEKDKNGLESLHTIATEPDCIVSGSKLSLVWEVKGHTRVDVEPIGKSLKGNAVDVIITESNREFTLVVHGLNGSISEKISVPLEMIKVLDTEKISENQNLALPKNAIQQNLIVPEIKKIDIKNRS